MEIAIIVAFVMQAIFVACVGLGLCFELHESKRHKTAAIVLLIICAFLLVDVFILIDLLEVRV